MQEADGDGLDARLLEQAHLAADGVLIERRDDLAVWRRYALGDDTAVSALDERARLPRQVLLDREVERLLVARDVEDVAEALGGDQADGRTLMRERDVGGDGRAVQEVVDLRQLDTGLLAEAIDALDHAACRIVGGGRNLVDGDLAGFLVHEDQVGEGAPDVYSDALHGCCSPASRCRKGSSCCESIQCIHSIANAHFRPQHCTIAGYERQG